MDKLVGLLFRQPLIARIVGAWVVSAVGNAIKGQRNARERSQKRKDPDPVSSPSASPSASPAASPAGQDAKVSRSVMGGPGTGVQAPVKAQRQAPVVGRATTQAGPAAAKPAAKVAARGPKTPDQIAAEMRRIFGLEDKSPATPPPSTPAPNPPAPVRMEPQPTASSSSAGRAVKSTYETSIDSHVGEAARDHHLLESTVGQVRGDRGAIGNLGGRVRKRKPVKASASRRFPLGDLRRVIVMNEILSPPVSLRGDDRIF